METRLTIATATVALVFFASVLAVIRVNPRLSTNNNDHDEFLRRAAERSDGPGNAHDEALRSRRLKEWRLPDWANKMWCNDPDLPPIDYHYCDLSQPVNLIRYRAGFKYGLPMILLGALESMEQKRCFVIDEQPTSGEQVCTTINGSRECFFKTDSSNSELQKYFELIGMTFDEPIVKRAIAMDMIEVWTAPSTVMKHRLLGMRNTVSQIIGYGAVDGHFLKRIAMRRIWRAKPNIRNEICQTLEDFGLENKYLGLNVIGDATASEYMHTAEMAINNVKGNYFQVTPKIFVATDDCSSVDQLRATRPQYTYLSMCGAAPSSVITDYGDFKFLVELYALGISEFAVVGRYSPMGRWAYFMKFAQHSFKNLDEKSSDFYHNYW